MIEPAGFDRPWRTLGFSVGVPATGLDEVAAAYVQQAWELIPAMLEGGPARDLALARRSALDHALDTICAEQLKATSSTSPRLIIPWFYRRLRFSSEETQRLASMLDHFAGRGIELTLVLDLAATERLWIRPGAVTDSHGLFIVDCDGRALEVGTRFHRPADEPERSPSEWAAMILLARGEAALDPRTYANGRQRRDLERDWGTGVFAGSRTDRGRRLSPPRGGDLREVPGTPVTDVRQAQMHDLQRRDAALSATRRGRTAPGAWGDPPATAVDHKAAVLHDEEIRTLR